jgi:hypothetical protein
MAQSTVIYIISSGMFGFGASVRQMNFEIMSLLTTNPPVGIKTNIECSVIPTLRQPITNTHGAMFTKNCMNLDILPES